MFDECDILYDGELAISKWTKKGYVQTVNGQWEFATRNVINRDVGNISHHGNFPFGGIDPNGC